MSDSITVVTHVHNQNKELKHLLRALKKVSFSEELVIVAMGEEDPYDIIEEDIPFSVKLFYMERPTSEPPLAQAKNIACSMSQGEILIFLNPNQIPTKGLIKNYCEILTVYPQSVIIGDRKELAKNPHKNWSFQYLENKSNALDARDDQDLFMHGNFALSKSLYMDINGFDERYDGHNAYIDFYYEIKNRSLSIINSKDALVYELKAKKNRVQRIDLDSLIKNSSLFFTKWGHFPTKSILEAFQTRGLIRIDENLGIVERAN